MSIQFHKRHSAFSELKHYCPLAGEHDYMEVTEWSNGEGYDITVSSKQGEQRFSLTHGEIALLQVLLKIQPGDQNDTTL